MFDPPSGWMYGFPKPIPKECIEDEDVLRAWLIEEGYPDPDLAIRYSRYYEGLNRDESS